MFLLILLPVKLKFILALQVLAEILYGLTAQEVKEGEKHVLAPKSDIESPPVHPEDDARGGSSSSSHRRNDEEFEAALLCLCVTVCDAFISADQDMSRHFDVISQASVHDEFSFLGKLNNMVERNSSRHTVYSLRAIRLAAKLVISMMRHKGRYCKQDLQSLMASLSQASEALLHLDNSMVFASGDDDDTTPTKPYRTLASLVKEAQGLVPAAPSSYVIET